MMKKLDMTGHPCPIPVVEAKKLLAQPDTDAVEVLVDNEVAVQNLEKMAQGTGCVFAFEKDSDTRYRVTIKKGPHTEEALKQSAAALGNAAAQARPAAKNTAEGLTVLITRQFLGGGSDELGAALMKGFIFSLTELSPAPKVVIFMNGGAHLTTRGANTVPDLTVLADKGTEVVTCGTCANFYGLSDKLAVGAITDMMGIVSRLAAAQNVITL